MFTGAVCTEVELACASCWTLLEPLWDWSPDWLCPPFQLLAQPQSSGLLAVWLCCDFWLCCVDWVDTFLFVAVLLADELFDCETSPLSFPGLATRTGALMLTGAVCTETESAFAVWSTVFVALCVCELFC